MYSLPASSKSWVVTPGNTSFFSLCRTVAAIAQVSRIFAIPSLFLIGIMRVTSKPKKIGHERRDDLQGVQKHCSIQCFPNEKKNWQRTSVEDQDLEQRSRAESNKIPASGVRVKSTSRTNEGNALNYLIDKASRNLLRRITERRDVLNVQRTTS
jgi:hypothetical protein